MYRLALLAVLVLGGAALAGEIEVSGDGQVKATPDTAAFDVAVSATAKTAKDASVQANLKAQKLLAALKDAGVKKDELRTDDVTVSPNYEKDADEPKSYTAENTVTVTVCDIKDAGKLMDVAINAGSGKLGRLRRGLKDDTKQSNEARTLAVKNARAKAEVLAAAEGLKVGQAKSIKEGYGYRQPRGVLYQTTASFRSDAETPVEAGVIVVPASVNVVFELVK